MRVVWTESALNDLGAVQDYLSRRSLGYEKAMVERIFDGASRLSDQPFFGPVVPEYGDETIREVFVNPFRVVYQTRAEEVAVVAVVHAARRLPPSF